MTAAAFVISALRAPKQAAFAAAGTGAQEVPLSGTLGVAYPTGIVFGSFLLLHVFLSHSAAPTITTPTGWTLIDSQADGANFRSSVYWRRADGTESGSLAVTVSGGDTFAGGRMYRMTGGNGVEAAGGARTAGAGTAMDAVNVTTLGPARLAVQMFATAVSSTTLGDISGESNADYTEAIAEFHSATGGFMLQLQTATIASAAAITGGSATLGTNGTQRTRHGFAITP